MPDVEASSPPSRTCSRVAEVLKETASVVAEFGLTEQYRLVEGNLLEADFGELGYDFVILGTTIRYSQQTSQARATEESHPLSVSSVVASSPVTIRLAGAVQGEGCRRGRG